MTRPTYIGTQIDMITNAADVITKFIILCFAFLPFAIIKLLSAHFVFLSIWLKRGSPDVLDTCMLCRCSLWLEEERNVRVNGQILSSIHHVCVCWNQQQMVVVRTPFNVQVIIYVVHMSHYLKEPRRHLPKKIDNRYPATLPAPATTKWIIALSAHIFVQNILLFQGEKGRWLFAPVSPAGQ
jgi:hypothetical protein